MMGKDITIINDIYILVNRMRFLINYIMILSNIYISIIIYKTNKL
jgi:hypothetical protein